MHCACEPVGRQPARHSIRGRKGAPIHRPNSVEPHRGILVQRCRPSLCLYRVIFGITAKENRAASVELTCRCWRPNLAYLAVLFARCVSHMITPRLACLGAPGRYELLGALSRAGRPPSQSARRGQNHDLEFSSTHDRYRSPDHRGRHLWHMALSTVHSR